MGLACFPPYNVQLPIKYTPSVKNCTGYHVANTGHRTYVATGSLCQILASRLHLLPTVFFGSPFARSRQLRQEAIINGSSVEPERATVDVKTTVARRHQLISNRRSAMDACAHSTLKRLHEFIDRICEIFRVKSALCGYPLLYHTWIQYQFMVIIMGVAVGNYIFLFAIDFVVCWQGGKDSY